MYILLDSITSIARKARLLYRYKLYSYASLGINQLKSRAKNEVDDGKFIMFTYLQIEVRTDPGGGAGRFRW